MTDTWIARTAQIAGVIDDLRSVGRPVVTASPALRSYSSGSTSPLSGWAYLRRRPAMPDRRSSYCLVGLNRSWGCVLHLIGSASSTEVLILRRARLAPSKFATPISIADAHPRHAPDAPSTP